MYVIYDIATGDITQVTLQHAGLPTALPDGVGLLEIAPDAGSLMKSFLVVGGRLTPRAVMGLPPTVTIALGEVVTYDVPLGAIAHACGEAHALADGILEIVGGMPSSYTIQITAPGYRDAEISVTVEDAP